MKYNKPNETDENKNKNKSKQEKKPNLIFNYRHERLHSQTMFNNHRPLNHNLHAYVNEQHFQSMDNLQA